MHYELSQPPRTLTDYVRYCWRLENNTGNTFPNPFSVSADGCPGLLFLQAQNGALYQEDKKLPTVLIYGQSTQHTHLLLPDTFSLLGICFQPDALKTLFALNAYDLTDSCLDVRDLSSHQGTYLLERLLQTPSSSATQFDALFAYLTAQVQQKKAPADPLVSQALTQLVRQGGNLSLRTLRETLRLSERSLERRFKQQVGVSPKLFARICRFQASLNRLKNKDFDKLSDIAFDCGYADQSHFTRTFKEFAGVLPQQYYRQADEVPNHFPELIA